MYHKRLWLKDFPLTLGLLDRYVYIKELTHLRFADDIVLVTSNIGDLQGMLQELEAKSKEIGRKINSRRRK